MDFSKNSLRMRLHNIRPFIVPITEFIDIPVVAEISDLPAGCRVSKQSHIIQTGSNISGVSVPLTGSQEAILQSSPKQCQTQVGFKSKFHV